MLSGLTFTFQLDDPLWTILMFEKHVLAPALDKANIPRLGTWMKWVCDYSPRMIQSYHSMRSLTRGAWEVNGDNNLVELTLVMHAWQFDRDAVCSHCDLLQPPMTSEEEQCVKLAALSQNTIQGAAIRFDWAPRFATTCSQCSRVALYCRRRGCGAKPHGWRKFRGLAVCLDCIRAAPLSDRA
jgi:hypothetical protein